MTTAHNRRWFQVLRYPLAAVACIASATLMFYLVARWHGSVIRRNDREALRTYILEGRADPDFQRGRGLFSDDESDEIKTERKRRLSDEMGRHEIVPNLTMANAETFALSIGKPIVLHGQLTVGKFGYALQGSTPGGVAFYVKPTLPASGAYGYPESRQKYLDSKVRVTGVLKFQPPPQNHYFMTLQNASIEALK